MGADKSKRPAKFLMRAKRRRHRATTWSAKHLLGAVAGNLDHARTM
jgi:hypothetical protein